MKINFAYAGRDFELTNERAESSYGVPVLVVDGIALGPADRIPARADDDLAWLDTYERAIVAVAAACPDGELKRAFLRNGFTN